MIAKLLGSVGNQLEHFCFRICSLWSKLDNAGELTMLNETSEVAQRNVMVFNFIGVIALAVLYTNCKL